MGQFMNILLVDDHADTSRALKRLLERMGYQVQTADSVSSALQASQSEPFDIVISDIGLPDGSGLDLMREIKAKGVVPPYVNLGGSFDVELVLSVMQHVALYWSENPPSRGAAPAPPPGDGLAQYGMQGCRRCGGERNPYPLPARPKPP